jgi:hypothetical protein
VIPREGLFRKWLAKQTCDWGDARASPLIAEVEVEIAASDGAGAPAH